MRKTPRALLLLIFLAAASAAGQQQTPAGEPSVKLPPDLARVLTDYEAAWSKRDPAALAGLFAEDGFVLPNGGTPVRGRAAIQKQHYTGTEGRSRCAPSPTRPRAWLATSSAGTPTRPGSRTSESSR
jgi:hypothetical protein